MKALSEKQQTAAQDQLVKLLCFNFLPMLLALILLGWLSFGLPHPTWALLLKTILQANTLIEQQGMAFLLPLLILAIQSIFLLSAWGLLIWGITREVKTLLAFYSDVATLQTPSPSIATATPVSHDPYASSPTPAQQPYTPTPSYAPAQPYAPTSSYPPPPPPPPPISYNPLSQDNPFSSDEEDFPTDIIDIPTQLTTPPAPRYASYEMLTGPNHRLESGIYPPLEENAHDEEDELRQPQKRSTSIQRLSPVSPPQQPEIDQEAEYTSWNRPEDQATKYYTPPPTPPEDPLEATVLSDRSKMNKTHSTEEGEQTPPARPKRQQKQLAPAMQDDPFAVVEDDPFAVQDNVLHVFEQEDPEEPIHEEDEQASDEDPVFVYGNPFEGPLPDVFIHDEDLKRSLEEQKTAHSDETASRALKKGNQKPTGIRKRS